MSGGDISVGVIGFTLPEVSIATVVWTLLRAAAGVAGIFMLARLVWSYFLLQTHGHNHDKEHHAMGALKEGLIGLIVVVVIAKMMPAAVAIAAEVVQRYAN